MEVNRTDTKNGQGESSGDLRSQLATEVGRLTSYDWLAVNPDGVLLYFGSAEQYPNDETKLDWHRTYGRFAVIGKPQAPAGRDWVLAAGVKAAELANPEH